MKKYALLLIPLIFTACTRVVKIDDAAEYTAVAYTPDYATGFELRSLPGDSSMMMLEVYRPDTMRIVIPKGGFHSLLCMSSTYVGTLSTVGTADRIVAVSGRDYLTDSDVKARAVEVGYEGAMNYEALLAAKPDVALIYGIGGESSLAAKLEELSVPYVYINDFEEQNPLGRAEWMVALGALTGVDGRARFAEIAGNYRPVAGSVPVMINAPYGGTWFIPGKDNYMSKLIADAGATIVAPQADGTDSNTIDLEEALPALTDAQIWLNPGQITSLKQVKDLVPKAKFNGSVWNQTPDFYESGSARPDLVVRELQSIVNATASDSMRYFIRLK